MKVYRFGSGLILLLMLLTACESTQTDLGMAVEYLPSTDRLREGVVNKYYYHVNPGPTRGTRTDVRYQLYQLTASDELTISSYNPGFEKYRTSVYTLQDNKMLLAQNEHYYGSDTFRAEIIQPVAISWNSSDSASVLELKMEYAEDNTWWNIQTQQNAEDTTVAGRVARRFTLKNRYQRIYQGDTTVEGSSYQTTYAAGLGFFEDQGVSSAGEEHWELVEQMPLSQFEQLADHRRKHVGYINPEEAIDQPTDFAICNSPESIVQYYHSSPDGSYAEGKRVMLNIIYSELDSSLLFDESGYLTFRFVVNCEGKAGWFITEQADLDFGKKEFNSQTIAHLYNIVYNLRTWSPSVIDGETRDTYFYLIFRLKDGKLVDVLP
ncbi:hypothetical protein [Tunicatimonas pelagia]|uniref:hypothetical protein n=1 Tax=Tunicatimonas pelagia TaxID=931531 RepID=UPI002665056B|nr:hypothetical protein [Tunicatimonas pelagia]WKN46162.1 hypothetical protein P0M28_14505 [Tunicatimonas pelagia]